ncbi:uncharacterized protein HMPREF1541_05204 [Cyphellophora europaea CBS 101466]|uniref:Mid2 domain-containing protein n=1 Tax=Cyphellophora europaea (strain CBS 101466) TaxID=1220924 RepID=W2RZ34_CYPE1|nr:uncharacterized protein HMPREF1541_05204 [Cyphellophora europaea CBS 101466]ETN40924.1 hypothetical protein HMPREF1541_05204 [Cyphellophora europaea CBS 101466]
MLKKGSHPLILLLGLAVSSAAAQICYGRQGVQVQGLVACNPGGGCCAKGDILTTGNGIQVCPGTGRYCCYGYTGCACDDPVSAVSIAAGTIVTTISWDYTTPLTSSTTSSPSSQITNPPPTTVPSSNETPVATTDATHRSSSSSSLSTSARVGVGVGVALAGLLLAGALTALFVHRRRRRSAWPTTRNRAELHYYGTEHKKLPHELDGKRPTQELHGHSIQWRTPSGPVEAPSSGL